MSWGRSFVRPIPPKSDKSFVKRLWRKLCNLIKIREEILNNVCIFKMERTYCSVKKWLSSGLFL